MIRSLSILIPDGAFRDLGTVAKTNKVEHCGDRQPKFDGLEKWPFRLFIKSPHHASNCAPPHLRSVTTVHVAGEHLCCTRRHLLHRSRHPLLRWGCGRRNILVRESVPNASIDSSPTSQRQWEDPKIFGGIPPRLRHPTIQNHHPTSPDRLIARFLGNARRRLAQGVRRSRRTGPLQITIQDTNTRPIAPRNCPGVHV